VIDPYVDIDGIADYHSLNFLFFMCMSTSCLHIHRGWHGNWV